MPDTQYDLNNTIVVVSSPSSQQRVIVRISGPAAFEICRSIFREQTGQKSFGEKRKILSGFVTIDDELKIETQLYLFPSGHSYTGDDVAEIHFYSNPLVTETLIDNLLRNGLRLAEPGEFTARAYLNGRMDLSQAEAVNEIIVSSNRFQLDAAEKLLSGRLSQTTALIGSKMTDCLSLIEAGLDFSGEDIEFITKEQAIERLGDINKQLDKMLAGSIRFESVIDLPSVAIAGAPNAGKSSLVNKLLGSERSIVSHESKTTRDVLTGQLNLEHCNCVLFDCAGLLTDPENILDKLAQEAAIEAIRNSAVAAFCVDISKPQWSEDLQIRRLIDPKILIALATKCDLIPKQALPSRLGELNRLFDVEFMPVSVETGFGLDNLRNSIDSHLVSGQEYAESPLAITARHKQAVNEAIANIKDAVNEISADNDEVAAMLLRTAYKSICEIQQHDPAVDEQILEQVFSRFCIGK